MLYSLFSSLVEFFSFFNVFKYLTVRTGLSMFTSMSVVFIVGGRNNSGSNKPKCIMFEQPVGLHKVGSYNINYNFYSSRNASKYNNSLSENNCR